MSLDREKFHKPVKILRKLLKEEIPKKTSARTRSSAAHAHTAA
jgi:hypothetical protein